MEQMDQKTSQIQDIRIKGNREPKCLSLGQQKVTGSTKGMDRVYPAWEMKRGNSMIRAMIFDLDGTCDRFCEIYDVDKPWEALSSLRLEIYSDIQGPAGKPLAP